MLNNVSKFLNTTIGLGSIPQIDTNTGLPKVTTGSVLKDLGSAIKLSPLSNTKKSSLSQGQTMGLGAMDIGMKAAENIPGVGAIFKAGNTLNNLMPDVLAGQNKADQFLNKVPGLKMLNFSIGKSKDFGLNQDVQNSAYGGSASEIKDVKDNYAGINQGLLSSIFGAKKKANRKSKNALGLQNNISDILDKGQLALDTQANMAQDVMNQNNFNKAGGYNSIFVGRKGMLLTKKDKSDSALILEKDHSIIPGGKLHARRHDLKDHDKELADSVTDKGIPVVTFEDGGEIEQHAEIEVGEIIIRLSVVEEINKLREKGDEESMIKAGKIIAKEITINTIDNSKEYELNN